MESQPACYFVALGEGAFNVLYPLSLTLKQHGIWVELGYDSSKSLKAQMKQANRSGATVAVILGDEELKNKCAQLKTMDTGEQATVAPFDR